MKLTNIVIANDHAAVNAKFHILEYLKNYDLNIINLGVDSNNSVDYPIYALELAKFLNQNKNTKGILLCGSGLGISIAANKFNGVRCMVCNLPIIAELARRMFDINVLGLGARIIGNGLMEAIIDKFLTTDFDDKNQKKPIE